MAALSLLCFGFQAITHTQRGPSVRFWGLSMANRWLLLYRHSCNVFPFEHNKMPNKLEMFLPTICSQEGWSVCVPVGVSVCAIAHG